MEPEAIDIFDKLFVATRSEPQGVNRKKFRAKYIEYKELIDDLETKQLICRDNNVYHVSLIALHEIAGVNKEAEHILFLCELIFSFLRRFYKDHAGDPVSLNNIAQEVDIPRSDVNKCIPYFMKSMLHEGYTTNPKDEDSATITPAENVLNFGTFRESIEDLKRMRMSSSKWQGFVFDEPISEHYFQGHDYIHQDRISSLKTLQSERFDFQRLVQICIEINSSAKHENYLATIILVRALLDHVPPVFEMDSFKAVVGNYKSSASLKKTLEHLEKSSRNIADSVVHQQIRKTESLPNVNQVNFSQDVDRFLEEVIRITEEKSKD